MPHSDALAALAYDELTGDLQHALAALADVEFAFQSACERLSEQAGPALGKDRTLEQLEAERRRRLEPLIRRLDALDRRMKVLMKGLPPDWQTARPRPRTGLVADLPLHLQARSRSLRGGCAPAALRATHRA